jgi:cell division septation protein DedD
MSNRLFLTAALLALATVSLPVHAVKPTPRYMPAASPNPAPVRPLGQYNRFELLPMTLNAEDRRHNTSRIGLEAMQVIFRDRVDAYTAVAALLAPEGEPTHTLVLAPKIRRIHYVTNASERLSRSIGPSAGVTRVLLEVRLTDATTGELVAAPQFYAGGGNATDAVVSQFVAYLGANLETAVGGPTGTEPVAK